MTTGRPRRSAPVPGAQHALSKVPEVTALFWITKVLTTGMGETTSDYLAHVLDPMIAVGIGGLGLVAALVLQFAVRRYVPWIYWTAIVMVSVFGTMAADALHQGLGVPYVISAPFFLIALAVIFVAWYASEKTLSIHSITTRRREVFYWATVLATFALGTATGDLSAATWGWGYLASGIVFAAVIAVPALAYGVFRLNAIATFWFAYVITRPLGASFADWMGVPESRSGLGWGTGPVSLALAVLIVGFVGWLTVTHKGADPAPAAPETAPYVREMV